MDLEIGQKSLFSTIVMVTTVALAVLWVAVDCLAGPMSVFISGGLEGLGFAPKYSFLHVDCVWEHVSSAVFLLPPVLDFFFMIVIIFLPRQWNLRIILMFTAGPLFLLLLVCDTLFLWGLAEFAALGWH